MSDQRRPLVSEDLERVVIGAAFLGDGSVPSGLEHVEERLFVKSEHRAIWAAIAKRVAAGVRIDLMGIAEDLRSCSELAGDPLAYLSACQGLVYSLAATGEHVSHLRELADLREHRRVLVSALERVDHGAASAAELRDDLAAALAGAESASRPVEISDASTLARALLGDLEARMAGRDDRIRTGLAPLDETLGGFAPGSLTVIAGRPSMGKSSLALNIARHVVLSGHCALVSALETTGGEIAANWVASDAAVSTWSLRNGELASREWQRVTPSLDRMSNNAGGLLVVDAPAQTPQSIAAMVRRAKRSYPRLALFVCDHIGLVQANAENREQAVAAVSRAMKIIAKEHAIAVIAVAQLNRESERREDRRPRLADLRDSGAIEQDADVILLLYRDEYYHPDREESKGRAEVNIAKHRNGPVDVVELKWEAQFVRFSEPEWREQAWSAPAAIEKGLARE